MSPPKEPGPALSAPGVPELLTPPGQMLSGPRENRRTRSRPYRHAHVEIDLAAEPQDPAGVPLLERLAALLKERKVVEKGSLIMMTAALLHALAARQFHRVSHWEVVPGGELPLPPGRTDDQPGEPVGDLIDALEGGGWSKVGKARSFSVQLSGPSGARADVTIRRVHRERRHAVTLDLRGTWTKATVQDVVDSIASRLPVAHSAMTKFMFA